MNKLSLIYFSILLGCQEKERSFSVSSQNNMGQMEDTNTTTDSGSEDSGFEDSGAEDSGAEDSCALDSNTADADPTELTGRVDCGEIVYLNICAACHGDNGEGTASATGLEEPVPERTDENLVLSITEGAGDMPAQNLHSQEVADVVSYLRVAFP